MASAVAGWLAGLWPANPVTLGAAAARRRPALPRLARRRAGVAGQNDAMNLLLAAACVTVVAGSLLQSATGFGFSLLAAPLTFAAVDPAPAAVGLLLLLGAEVNLL